MKASLRHPGRVRRPRGLIRLWCFIALAVLLLATLMPVPPACDPSPTLHAAKTP
jgi:hypothetical protein